MGGEVVEATPVVVSATAEIGKHMLCIGLYSQSALERFRLRLVLVSLTCGTSKSGCG